MQIFAFDTHRCLWFFVVVIVVSFSSVLLVFFAIYKLSTHNDRYQNLFIGYRSCYWLLLSLAALIGYVASREFRSVRKRLSLFEYFVLIAGGAVAPALC